MRHITFNLTLALKLLAIFICFFFITCSVTKVKQVPVVASKRPEGAAVVSGGKFSEHVRTTEFQTPDQEQAAFNLPPGFEITLFASEPDISKPINRRFRSYERHRRYHVEMFSEYL